MYTQVQAKRVHKGTWAKMTCQGLPALMAEMDTLQSAADAAHRSYIYCWTASTCKLHTIIPSYWGHRWEHLPIYYITDWGESQSGNSAFKAGREGQGSAVVAKCSYPDLGMTSAGNNWWNSCIKWWGQLVVVGPPHPLPLEKNKIGSRLVTLCWYLPLCWLERAWFVHWALVFLLLSFWSVSCPGISLHTCKHSIARI